MRKKPKEVLDLTEAFRRLFFFDYLDEAAISRLSMYANAQKFRDEETIMLAGDSRNAIFFITKGQARIFSDNKNSRGSILSLMGTGDFFGEIQIFSEVGRNSISVKANGECEVIIFKGKDFFNEMVKNPKLSIAFLKEESRKVNRAYIQIASLSMSTVRRKVRSCIMQFVDDMGVQIPQSEIGIVKIKNIPSQQQIAEMSGTTRETVNRELSVLMKTGYIKLEGRDLIVIKEFECT